MQQTCKNCQHNFDIFNRDIAFYEKINVPLPTLCSTCRQQRRTMYRNERYLYKKNCDLCQKPVITVYGNPIQAFPVYCISCFWSDNWDPLDYGKEFDFKRSFFEQWQGLRNHVPRIALLSKNSENCEYTNHASNNRNCYMSTVIFNCEEVYFSRKIFNSKFIFDCNYTISNGENLYECFWASNLYDSFYSDYCHNSDNLQFCYDCRGCSNCFMSSNLRNKKYIFRNKQLTKIEYQKVFQILNFGSFEMIKNLREEYAKLKIQTMQPALRNTNTEQSTGDFLLNTKNCFECYYSQYAEDCRYCIECDPSAKNIISKNCMDSFGFGSSELLYEINAMANGYNNQFCNMSYDVNDSLYLDMCFNVNNCFGCIGLHNKQEFCIFNNKYTVKEYNVLKNQIIDHMKKTGEWGQFFPILMSPFGYNESAATEFAPMSKKQVLAKGWQWYEPKQEFRPQTYQIPDHIKDVPDSITNEILACGSCGRNFKIIIQELAFYRKHNLPIPRKCQNCRYLERLKSRNPYKLHYRKCQKCSTDIQTTYAPDRPETVYCEKCYLQEVY